MSSWAFETLRWKFTLLSFMKQHLTIITLWGSLLLLNGSTPTMILINLVILQKSSAVTFFNPDMSTRNGGMNCFCETLLFYICVTVTLWKAKSLRYSWIASVLILTERWRITALMSFSFPYGKTLNWKFISIKNFLIALK